jgi:hypothetical protein
MPELGEITEVEVELADGERIKVKLMTIGVKKEKKPDAKLEGQSGQKPPAKN